MPFIEIKRTLTSCVLRRVLTSDHQELSCSDQEVKVTNSRFSQNHHKGSGGILYVVSSISLTVFASDFTDTSCTDFGGHTCTSGIGTTTYERVCTTRTFSGNLGQSEAFLLIKGQVEQSLCSFTFSPNNQEGLPDSWYTVRVDGDSHKALLKSINISHSDFAQDTGRGGILSCKQTEYYGRVELGTFTSNRLCCLISYFNGEITKSNVVNNSHKTTASSQGLFYLDSSNEIDCSDTIFISNHFASLLYNNQGTIAFTNSFFFDSSFTSLTSFPTTEPMPTTWNVSYACPLNEKYFPTKEFTEMSPSIKEMLMKLVLFLIMLG